MGQIKVYGLENNLKKNREKLSEIIHSSVVKALEYPKDKKFHRFISLSKDEFYFPSSRTDDYIIIEISIFEGRSIEAKKNLIKEIYVRAENELNISKEDIEITIFETPKCNWGIRGLPGDELMLNYKVDI